MWQTGKANELNNPILKYNQPRTISPDVDGVNLPNSELYCVGFSTSMQFEVTDQAVGPLLYPTGCTTLWVRILLTCAFKGLKPMFYLCFLGLKRGFNIIQSPEVMDDMSSIGLRYNR